MTDKSPVMFDSWIKDSIRRERNTFRELVENTLDARMDRGVKVKYHIRFEPDEREPGRTIYSKENPTWPIAYNVKD